DRTPRRLRLQCFSQEREPGAVLWLVEITITHGARRDTRTDVVGPVVQLGTTDIDGDDFSRATTFELECKEDVVRSDVDATLALDVRPGQAIDHRPKIEDAFDGEIRRDVDRVVPERSSAQPALEVGVEQRHGAGLY